ncbi:hypothetical protein AERO8C_30208 [Aeromonas veronii]|uniref:Uncharacterized protein n=1 Tax=Aeromonas veronii TaxID=654 RepID=A0A653L5W7_AERVE|nr:hypothetical protein AERO8C_30208 [Aeromonas veronii]
MTEKKQNNIKIKTIIFFGKILFMHEPITIWFNTISQ